MHTLACKLPWPAHVRERPTYWNRRGIEHSNSNLHPAKREKKKKKKKKRRMSRRPLWRCVVFQSIAGLAFVRTSSVSAVAWVNCVAHWDFSIWICFCFCLNSQSRNQKKNREIGWWMFVWFPLLPERSGCDRKHDVACVCAADVIVVSRCRRCTIRKMRVSRWTDTRYGKPLWVRCAGQQNGRRKGHSWNGMVSEDAAGLITPQAIGFYTVDGSLRRSFRPFRPQTRPFDTNHRKGYHAQFSRYFDV